MERINQQIERVKRIFAKYNLFKWITLLGGVYLLAETVRNTCYGAESEFQILREYYYYRGCVFFLVLIILLRKVKIWNPLYLACIFGYAGYSVKYLIDHRSDYGEQLAQLNNAKYLAQGLFLLVILDVILSKQLSKLNMNNKLFVIVAFLAIIMVNALNYYYAQFILMPSLALFVTPMTKKQWQYFVDCLSIGFYLAFAWIMAKSLIDVPFTGERYYGTFLNLYTAAAFAGCAFICAVYMFIRSKDFKYCSYIRIACLTAMIFPVISVSMIGARSAQFAILVTLFFCFSIFGDISKIKKRICVAAVIFTVFLAVGTVILIVLSYNRELIEHLPKNFIIYKLEYWMNRGRTLMTSSSRTGLFSAGTLVNAIDSFSSGRLSIYYEAIRTNTWFGSSNLTVVTDYVAVVYPHNGYLLWTRAFGWIGGIPAIAWFFIGLVNSIKQTVKRNKAFYLTVIWTVYLATTFFTDCILWDYPPCFVLILLQYPLLIQFKSDECEKETEDRIIDKENLAN